MDDLLNLDISYFVMKECSPLWSLSRRVLPFYDLLIVLDGSASYLVDDREYNVEKGCVLLIPPGSSREAKSSGMTCAAFDFTTHGMAVGLPVLTHGVRTEELMYLLREFNGEWLQKNKGYMMKCGALLMLILHKIFYGTGSQTANPYVEKIKRRIVEHLCEPINVSMLAEAVGLNPVYCGALFKKVQGCSISQYINRLRVNSAASLLEKGDCGIGEAAFKTGFSDIYHFSRVFKQITGISPSVYKKSREGIAPFESELFHITNAFLQD